MKHIFLINPQAGRRDAQERIRAMAAGLRARHALSVDIIVTRQRGHAEQLARSLAESGEALRFYACGGDGTAHEVANGIAGFANAAMSCIPIGTGNDFLKNFGADAVKFRDAENLWNGPQRALDLIACNDRLCLTIACCGLDARIAESVHERAPSLLLGGRASYLRAIAVNFLFRRIAQPWTVQLDGETLSGDFTLLALCNGRHYGGGSTPIPAAGLCDGALQAVLVEKISRLRFARLFPRYSAGRIATLDDAAIRVQTVRELSLHSEEEIVTCLDGECFRTQTLRMRLSDKKVNVFFPAGSDPDATRRCIAVP